MDVKLLKDVSRGRGAADMTVRRGRIPIVWEKGAVISMSDASARKYIKLGVAEAFDGAVAKATD